MQIGLIIHHDTLRCDYLAPTPVVALTSPITASRNVKVVTRPSTSLNYDLVVELINNHNRTA